MDKAEIEKQIKICELCRDLNEVRLNDLNLQLFELAEAEKPKLGHGDFGVNKDNKGFVATEGLLPIRQLEPYYKDGQSDGCNYAKNHPCDYTILGNIFDLLKQWSEPLKETWSSKLSRTSTRRIDIGSYESGIWLGTSGEADYYSDEIAYEIWVALGRAIFQKQSSHKT